MSPMMAQAGLKTARAVEMLSPRGAKRAQDGSKMAQVGVRGASVRPRWPQDGTKRLQGSPKLAPRCAQDGPKMAQDASKTAPRWSPDRVLERFPRQMGPRWLLEALRWTKMAPRWPKITLTWHPGPNKRSYSIGFGTFSSMSRMIAKTLRLKRPCL